MKILFFGTHGQYNLGDEILLETFLQKLGDKNQYIVNSYDPKDTYEKHNQKFKIQTFHTTKDILKLPKLIWQSDILFFGGGSILKELNKLTGRNKYSTLLMILAICVFSNFLLGKKIVMSNIGAGPVRTKFGIFLIKLILLNTKMAAFRDIESYNIALKTKVNQNKLVSISDAVFARTRSSFNLSPNKTYKTDLETQKVIKIGLNLNKDVSNPDNWNYFITNLAEDLVKLSQKYNIEIHTVPMQIGFNPENDIKTLAEFVKLIPTVKIVNHVPEDSTQLANLLDSCDLIIAERLHTLIISTIIGTPYVSLNYDVKVESLIKSLGLEKYNVNINTKFNPNEILEKTSSLIQNYTQACTDLKAKSHLKNQELETYFINLKSQLDL